MNPVCVFVGDCIAMGLATLQPQCDANVKVGRTPQAIAAHTPRGHHMWAVISSGSNNKPGAPFAASLRRTRQRSHADRYIWIVPVNQHNGAEVRKVAGEHGDKVVTIGRTSLDGVHPASYATLWRAVRLAIQGNRAP